MISQQETLTKLVLKDVDQSAVVIDGLLPDDVKRYLKDSPYCLPQEPFPLRAFLLLLAAKRYGITGKRPVQMAAAIQMIHYASLLHDRLGNLSAVSSGEDADNSGHSMESMDVLLGDFFFARASALIIDDGKEEIIEDMLQTSLASAEVQARVLSLDVEAEVQDMGDHFSAVSGKLSLFLSLSCRVGSLMGKAPVEERKILSSYGQCLGRAVSIAEDLRFWKGIPQGAGLPPSDPRFTYPVLLLRKERGNRIWQEVWAQGEDASSRVQHLRDVLTSQGYLDRAMDAASRCVEEACRHLDTLPFSDEIPVFKEIAERRVRVGDG